MKQVLFIYNPVAGTGRVKKNLYEIVDFYNSQEYLITLCPVRKLEEFFGKSNYAKKEYDRIVCSGGDGTLNIVLTYFKRINCSEPIAYIPSGSTNDYAYSLGIPENFNEALIKTLEGEIKQFDIGKFNAQYFLYVAGFGMFTNVSYNTSQKFKNLLGHTAYILEGIRQLSEIKSYHMTVVSDDKVYEGDFILGLVTNSVSIGGFKTIMPNDVELDDGIFEVILIRTPKTFIELQELIVALMGEKIQGNKEVTYFKTKYLHIISQEEIEWTLDGEYGGKHKEVEIENLEKDVEIYV